MIAHFQLFGHFDKSSQVEIFLITYHSDCRIYVFGGGQAHKLRFNDTLKLTLSKQDGEVDGSSNPMTRKTKVERVSLAEGSLIPSPRTYHASCLIDKYMVVSGGESNNTDMTDMWALDIEE